MKSFGFCFLALAILMNSCSGGKGGNRGQTLADSNSNPQTTSIINSETISQHPVINVYLENSGSMNGYVDNGKTMFQQDVYNYLSDVNISQIPSEMNLFFINSQIIPHDNVLSDFINKLNPSSFRMAGGQTGTTDMSDIFKMILEKTANDTVSIFISDCIFSPGNVSSPEAYLTNQQIGIKESMAKYVSSHPSFGVMVYQLYSNFNGRYYDFRNKPHNYSGERPYYIWVMGDVLHLENLRKAIPNHKFQGSGVSNFWCASPITLREPNFTILPSPRIGSFDKNGKTGLSKVKPDENGDFMFTIAADLSMLELLLGNDYLMNTDNYARLISKQLSEDIGIRIERNTIATSPATHNISLITHNYIPRGDITLILQCHTPLWATQYTDDNDTDLTDSNSRKTYGLKYLFDGVHQGLTARTSGIYTEMNVNLK